MEAAVGHWKKRLRDEGGRMKGELALCDYEDGADFLGKTRGDWGRDLGCDWVGDWGLSIQLIIQLFIQPGW